MRLEIEGAPPLWVTIRSGRVDVAASRPDGHEVRVSLSRDGIDALKSRRPAQLITVWKQGGLRVRGRPRFIRQVLGARRVYTLLLQELLKKPSASSR